jgi:preprotein translocase subunit SecB
MPNLELHPTTEERVVATVQYIKDLSFEVPRSPAIYQDIWLLPALDFKLDVLSTLITPTDGPSR